MASGAPAGACRAAEMTRTRVVNIRRERCDVYIGRGSPFGNAYVLGMDGDRDEVVRKFEMDFREKVRREPAFLRQVLALDGKALG